MPDLAKLIEEKNEEYRSVADEILSDEFDEYDEGKQSSLKEKRDDLFEELQDLKKQKQQQEELRSGGDNEPIKPEQEESESRQKKVDDANNAHERRSTQKYHEYYDEYLRKGEVRMDDEKVDYLRETRDMATNDDNKGGFLVPEEMEESITEARKKFNGIRDANITEITTETGAPLDLPTNDGTGNKGEILGEGKTVSNQDITVGTVTLEAWTFSSKDVNVSRQLLQDAAIDLESFIGDRLGERIGRKAGELFTTGTGQGEPHGVVPASTEGVADAGSNSSFDEQDFIDLKHSIDEAYRDNAQWMMHDNSLKEVKSIKDGNNRHVLFEGNQSLMDNQERRPTIDGDPVIINNEMASSLADGNKTVLYGDFSRYWIREIQGVELMRLDEINARSNQVTFLAFARMDGNLLDAGQGPIVHLNQ